MRQGKQVRQLGATGLAVSPLGLGTNRWAYGKNDEAVAQTFRAYVDAGGNFFDTAEVYGFGKSERLLGACLRQDARPTVIASKYLPLPLHPFKQALDGSLKRLGVPTIDLYYLHFPRGNLEQLMDQMVQVVADGTIRAVGVSNFSAAQMRQAAARLARYDLPLASTGVDEQNWGGRRSYASPLDDMGESAQRATHHVAPLHARSLLPPLPAEQTVRSLRHAIHP